MSALIMLGWRESVIAYHDLILYRARNNSQYYKIHILRNNTNHVYLYKHGAPFKTVHINEALTDILTYENKNENKMVDSSNIS